jgi:hypothetical protein
MTNSDNYSQIIIQPPSTSFMNITHQLSNISYFPQPIILQNPNQMNQCNSKSRIENSTSFNSSFKDKVAEILATQFPKVLKDYILYIIQSNQFPNFHFGKSIREIKRLPTAELLKFIQSFSQLSFPLLNEDICVCLVFEVYNQHINIKNQKKVRIENFIHLYSIVLSQFGNNSQLASMKAEIENIFLMI